MSFSTSANKKQPTLTSVDALFPETFPWAHRARRRGPREDGTDTTTAAPAAAAAVATTDPEPVAWLEEESAGSGVEGTATAASWRCVGCGFWCSFFSRSSLLSAATAYMYTGLHAFRRVQNEQQNRGDFDENEQNHV